MSNATGEISYGGVTGLPYKKISRMRSVPGINWHFTTWIRIPNEEASKYFVNEMIDRTLNIDES